ncbi:hypothetical protein CPLU01_01488 [Colletotrichum plurivorum]|uniref:Uncharacterized protein n=1 Tax=Colletotrichum plurivorum TaxID=2175906 RepID=A0A8H6U396_9PEZI|nr:hypothetical protein CPLU01_01488 [Colletotrichum plurivorum]
MVGATHMGRWLAAFTDVTQALNTTGDRGETRRARIPSGRQNLASIAGTLAGDHIPVASRLSAFDYQSSRRLADNLREVPMGALRAYCVPSRCAVAEAEVRPVMGGLEPAG